jgi:hypothetical protein
MHVSRCSGEHIAQQGCCVVSSRIVCNSVTSCQLPKGVCLDETVSWFTKIHQPRCRFCRRMLDGFGSTGKLGLTDTVLCHCRFFGLWLVPPSPVRFGCRSYLIRPINSIQCWWHPTMCYIDNYRLAVVHQPCCVVTSGDATHRMSRTAVQHRAARIFKLHNIQCPVASLHVTLHALHY